MADTFIRGFAIDWGKVEEDSYLREIPALRTLSGLDFHRNVTMLVGENGSGKSTLLEALATAYGFNAEGGTINFHFSTYDDVSVLGNAVRLIRNARKKPSAGYFFRAESFFNVATAIMEKYNDDGKLPDYHRVSHGESFLDFLSHSERQGLYLMDEPEAALSPQRQLTLLIYILRMAEAGSQFIIATHSPILLGIPEAELLSFSDGGIVPCAYEDTESYQVTRMFLENRERMIRLLTREEPEDQSGL